MMITNWFGASGAQYRFDPNYAYNVDKQTNKPTQKTRSNRMAISQLNSVQNDDDLINSGHS